MDKTMLAALMPQKPTKEESGIHSILYGEPKSGKTTTLDDPNMKSFSIGYGRWRKCSSWFSKCGYR
jgi:hypothetical protein